MSNCERGQIYIALALLVFGIYHEYGQFVNAGIGVLIGTGIVLVVRWK